MRYILPVILLINFSTVFAHAVDEPCFFEISLLTPRQELLELSDSNLKLRKLIFQDSINHHFFGRPFGGDWIEPFQFGENFCAEGRGCLVKSGFSVNTVSDISAKYSDKDASYNFLKVVDKKFDHPDSDFDWFWWFVNLPLALTPLWASWLIPGFYSS